MRQRLTQLGAVLSCLLVAAACSSGGGNSSSTASTGGPLTPATVNLAVVRSAQFSPVYVAMDRGYFKERGVDLKLTEVSTLQDAFPLLASGKLDAAIGGVSSGFFSAIDQGFKLKLVASIGSAPGTKPSPTALLVRKELIDSGQVKTLADLKGKKIAAAGGASGGGGWNLMVMYRKAGMTIDQSNVVALGNPDMANALKSGAIDAAVATAPFSTNIIQSGIGLEFGDPLPRGYGAGGLVYSAQFTQSPGAQRFYDAFAHGIKDVATEGATSDEIAKIVALKQYVGQDIAVIKSSPSYAYGLDLFRPQTHAAWFTDLQTESIRLGYLKLKAPVPTSGYVDTTFADHTSVH